DTMNKSILLRCLIALLLMAVLVGCERKSGDAVVIRKNYVAAVKQGEEIKDERATNHEQWIVKTRMLDNGRMIEVHVDQAQWEKLRENDRVKSPIGWASIPERFGTPRLSENQVRVKLRSPITFFEFALAFWFTDH